MAVLLLAAGWTLPGPLRSEEAKGAGDVLGKECFACHAEVASLTAGGRHAQLPCVTCHDGTREHLADPSRRPATKLGPETCGTCHPDQYRTFGTVNLDKPARTPKALRPESLASSVVSDKLLLGFGSLKESDIPRSHAFMLVDHLASDRAYGGRFQPKKGWSYVVQKGPMRAWDVLEDRHPETDAQKPFRRETIASATPNCFMCKTQDHILNWNYLGRKDKPARWDAGSSVVRLARSVQNAMNCFFCHDPHGAAARIVQAPLIEALERPERDTLWHKDPRATKVKVVDFRGGSRRIGLLAKPDAKLQCGQCHVEHDCHPGAAAGKEEEVGCPPDWVSRFPLKSPLDMPAHYAALRRGDYRHKLTGATLVRAQHPDVEAFWDSPHDKAGAACDDCHMPKMENSQGKVFTSHWQTSPRHYLKETCLRCHKNWDAAEAVYAIDSIRNYTRGKMLTAIFGLSRLIDTIVAGRKAGLGEDVLNAARKLHSRAHMHWEWCMTEDSGGFHNPELARDSLTRSAEESEEGIRLIQEALASPPRKPAGKAR